MCSRRSDTAARLSAARHQPQTQRHRSSPACSRSCSRDSWPQSTEKRIDHWLTDHHHHRKPRPEQKSSWVERRLSQASARIAFIVGAVINLPGPFYLLALGDIAHGGYSIAQQLALTLLFNAIMFLLLETPLVGYLLRPKATTERVAATSRWLNANGLRITGALIGVLGAGLLIQGIAATAA
ncbi:MAG: GAP family protein [Solirubrobacteraceae bacterium]